MGTDTLAYTYALVVLVGGIAGYLKSGKDLINNYVIIKNC